MEVDGKIIELGASVYIKENKLIDDFVSKLGLTSVSDLYDADTFGVWNGESFSFISSSNNYWNIAKLFWKYGFTLMTLNSDTNKLL